MGVIIGVVVGYVMGSRAGPDAWSELEEAWQTIISSEEVQDLVAGGISMARDLLSRRTEILASVLGGANSDSILRPVA